MGTYATFKVTMARLGYDVAEKMGVLDELRHDLKVQEFRIVNRVGRRTGGFNQGAVQKLIKGRGMSLLRRSSCSCSPNPIPTQLPSTMPRVRKKS